VRFLVNMSVSPKVAAALAEMGHEARHCAELGMQRASDEEILARARREGAVAVTADHDFPRIAFTVGVELPGLLLFRLETPSAAETIRRLREVLPGLREQSWKNRIVVVEPARVRVSEVPTRS
jgi:predicted nuclease of predicted toxin-antitoxin system